jgi:hypothetical protein
LTSIYKIVGVTSLHWLNTGPPARIYIIFDTRYCRFDIPKDCKALVFAVDRTDRGVGLRFLCFTTGIFHRADAHLSIELGVLVDHLVVFADDKYQLTISYLENNQRSEALQTVQRALQLQPNSALLLALQSKILSQ